MEKTKKQILISEAKEKLKFIPSSRVDFDKRNNQGLFYLWWEKKHHTLIALEWIKHDNTDFIQLESTNETMNPNKMYIDTDDLSDFDTDEVERILRMAKLL